MHVDYFPSIHLPNELTGRFTLAAFWAQRHRQTKAKLIHPGVVSKLDCEASPIAKAHSRSADKVKRTQRAHAWRESGAIKPIQET
jgi:hypothetical protein